MGRIKLLIELTMKNIFLGLSAVFALGLASCSTVSDAGSSLLSGKKCCGSEKCKTTACPSKCSKSECAKKTECAKKKCCGSAACAAKKAN